jgi:4-amino-4-deoxy-L-arabinose transferase-like glycosyltransferase
MFIVALARWFWSRTLGFVPRLRRSSGVTLAAPDASVGGRVLAGATVTLRRMAVTGRRNSWRLDASLLAVVALLIRLPAYFSSRELVVDEGVYSSAALAMRDGALPFREVFSAQGPLHLPLVYAFDLFGGRTLDSPRLLSVVSGLVVTVAVYAIGRRIGTRESALLAAALVTTTGSILWTTAPLTGDGPAAALTALAVLGAFAWRDEPSSRRAILTGVAMGAALAVKVLVAVAAIPIGLVFLFPRSRRGARDLAAAVAAAVVVIVAATLPWGVSHVIDQSVTFHTNGPRLETIHQQFNKLVTTLPSRDLPLVAAVVIGLLAAALTARTGTPEATTAEPATPGVGAARRLRRVGGTRRRRAQRWAPLSTAATRDVWIVVAWLVPLLLLLVFEKNMWRPHIAAVTLPLALLVALRPPPLRWFAVALIFLVPWWAIHLHDILWPAPASGSEAAVVAEMHTLPKGAWVISDEPGLAWRAGRRVPASLVDGSILRIDEHLVTTTTVARAAAGPHVCAVVVWTSRYVDHLPGLPAALQRDGYAITHRYRGGRAFWLKQTADCAPRG